MQLDGTLVRGTIDATAKLQLQALSAEPLPKTPNFGALGSKFLGFLSLGSALKIITNHQGDVNLRVPISGDLKSPDFYFGSLVSKGLVNGIRGAAGTIFSPIGGVFAGSKGYPLRFKDIEFAPGSNSPSTSDTAYLDSMARIMAEYPGVRILVCGKATASDFPELPGVTPGQSAPVPIDSLSRRDKQRLFSLATERARAIKNRLIRNGRIDAGRIFLCAPELDHAKAAKPRVEISTQ